LSWTWYGVLDLLICCVKLVIYGGLIVVIVPLLFVLAAQLYGWSFGGNWHPVPVTELLQILGFEPSRSSSMQQSLGFLLALPATLALFVIAVLLFFLERWLGRLEGRHHQRLVSLRQRDVVGAIEHVLAKPQRAALPPGA
jgi:hypothetical protein